MKKFYLSLSVLIMFFSFNAAAYSFETASLSGKKFDIYLISTGEIEGYCSPFRLKTDQLSFSGDTFKIDGIKGIVLKNEFSESMLGFEGEYETTSLLNGYRVSINGINLADIMIFGTADIRYLEFKMSITNPYEEIQQADAFFIGVRN